MPLASCSIGAHETKQAGHHAHAQRVAPYRRPVEVRVHQEDGECDGRIEACRIGVEEGRVAARVVAQEDRVTGPVAKRIVVLEPEAPGRG